MAIMEETIFQIEASGAVLDAEQQTAAELDRNLSSLRADSTLMNIVKHRAATTLEKLGYEGTSTHQEIVDALPK